MKQSFAKPEIVIDSHLHALTNLSPVTKSNDFGSLRRQHDIIQSHISSLSSLGVLEETYSKMALPLIIKSLPTRLQFKLTELLEDPAKRYLKAVMTALLNNIEKEMLLGLAMRGMRGKATLYSDISEGVHYRFLFENANVSLKA